MLRPRFETLPYSTALGLSIETIPIPVAVTIIAPIVPTIVRIRRAAIPLPLLYAPIPIPIKAVAFPLFYSPIAIEIQPAGSFISIVAAVIITIVRYTTHRRCQQAE